MSEAQKSSRDKWKIWRSVKRHFKAKTGEETTGKGLTIANCNKIYGLCIFAGWLRAAVNYVLYSFGLLKSC